MTGTHRNRAPRPERGPGVPARWAQDCTVCGQPITLGQLVVANTGRLGAAHIACKARE